MLGRPSTSGTDEPTVKSTVIVDRITHAEVGNEPFHGLGIAVGVVVSAGRAGNAGYRQAVIDIIEHRHVVEIDIAVVGHDERERAAGTTGDHAVVGKRLHDGQRRRRPVVVDWDPNPTVMPCRHPRRCGWR